MASKDRNLYWTEVRPGRWERDIDEVEAFYTALARQYAGSGRHFFGITGHVAIRVKTLPGQSVEDCELELEEALRKAWAKQRFDTPTLASWVEYDEGAQRFRKVYETPEEDSASPRGLASWLKETFHSVFTDKTGADWANSDPPLPKLPTLFVLKTSNSLVDGLWRHQVRRTLVLRAPHDVVDGVGTLLLLDELLKKASAAFSQGSTFKIPLFGDESTRLSPPFRTAANVLGDLSPKQLERLNIVGSQNAAMRKDVAVLTIPFRKDSPHIGRHQRVAISLPVYRTSEILKACKDRNITATHMFHAAIAMTLRDLQPRGDSPRTARYVCYCLINERQSCLPPFSTPAHAVATYHSVAGPHLGVDLIIAAKDQMTQVDGSTDGTEHESTKTEINILSQKFKTYYTSIREDPFHLALTPTYWAPGTPTKEASPLVYSSQIPPLPLPNESPSVSLSSLGMVDKIVAPQHGAVSVRDPWVTGEELGTGLGVYLATFDGEMTLSAAYNDAYHDKKAALAFLQHCQEIVEIGLGL